MSESETLIPIERSPEVTLGGKTRPQQPGLSTRKAELTNEAKEMIPDPFSAESRSHWSGFDAEKMERAHRALRRNGFSSLGEAVYMAIAEKQAYAMAFLSVPSTLRGVQKAALFIFYGGWFILAALLGILFSLHSGFEECLPWFEPVVFILETTLLLVMFVLFVLGGAFSFCKDLEKYTSLASVAGRILASVYLVIILFASVLLFLFGMAFVWIELVSSVSNVVLFDLLFNYAAYPSADLWGAIALVVALLVCALFTLPFAVTCRSSEVKVVGELLSFLSFVFSGFSHLLPLDVIGSGDYASAVLGCLILIPVLVFCTAVMKEYWQNKFFFGNDINRDRVFRIPAVSRSGEMEDIPAILFLRSDNRGNLENGSIVKNVRTFLLEKLQ